MKKDFRYYILLALLLISIISGYGQTTDHMFRCSLRDKAGNLWFGTGENGVYHYDVASGKFIHFSKDDGLNDNHVESIFEDKSGNIWIGTDYGVCCYSPSTKLFTDLSAKAGLCKFNINCFIEDKYGNIWIGSNGWGMSRYNPVTGEVTNFTKEQGLGSNAVQCVLEDKSGNIWCGERAGGVSRFDTSSGSFTKVNSDGCFSDQMMGIVEDNSGRIWFANLYHGVCRYDPSTTLGASPATNTYTHFTTANGFCNDTVTCIYKSLKGEIWFGCGSNKWNAGVGGLCRYNDGPEPFSSFKKLNGDASTDVWTIVEENDGTMWVGTRGGLWRYHSASGRFIDYTYKVDSKN